MGKFVFEESDNLIDDRIIVCKIVLLEVVFIYFDELDFVIRLFWFLLKKFKGIGGVYFVFKDKNNFIFLV